MDLAARRRAAVDRRRRRRRARYRRRARPAPPRRRAAPTRAPVTAAAGQLARQRYGDPGSPGDRGPRAAVVAAGALRTCTERRTARPVLPRLGLAATAWRRGRVRVRTARVAAPSPQGWTFAGASRRAKRRRCEDATGAVNRTAASSPRCGRTAPLSLIQQIPDVAVHESLGTAAGRAWPSRTALARVRWPARTFRAAMKRAHHAILNAMGNAARREYVLPEARWRWRRPRPPRGAGGPRRWRGENARSQVRMLQLLGQRESRARAQVFGAARRRRARSLTWTITEARRAASSAWRKGGRSRGAVLARSRCARALASWRRRSCQSVSKLVAFLHFDDRCPGVAEGGR